MTGLLDFLSNAGQSIGDGLFGKQAPTEGPSMMAQGGMAAANGDQGQMMKTAPVMQHQPGLLDRARDPGTDGVSFLDRLGAIGATLRDDANPMVGQQMIQQKQQAAKAQADKKADLQRKNAAFKAAYRPGADGRARFDPAAYVDALGDAGDASDALGLAKDLAPHMGVDGGTPYTQDPFSGETQWGHAREMSPSEKLRQDQMDQMEAYRAEQMDLARQREERAARQGDERLGLSRQREGRIGAGGGGGGGKLPTGFILD